MHDNLQAAQEPGGLTGRRCRAIGRRQVCLDHWCRGVPVIVPRDHGNRGTSGLEGRDDGCAHALSAAGDQRPLPGQVHDLPLFRVLGYLCSLPR